MADCITNNASYTSLYPCTGHENDILVSLATLRRYSQDQKYKAQFSREVNIHVRDEQLFHTKNIVPEIHSMTRRPFMGLSCQNCTFTSRRSLIKGTTEKLALINVLNTQISRTFPHLYQINGPKKFKYSEVAKLVLEDDRVQRAIEKAAVQQFQDSNSNDDVFYQEYLQGNQRRAVDLLFNMRSTLSDFLIRFTSWILCNLLPCWFSLLVLHPGQVKMLNESSRLNLPIILLPLHKSHLDYILLSFILLNNNIRSPLVPAGNNLRIPFFGSLLRRLGAFFIKSRIDPSHQDYVYKAVLQTYLNLCLSAGYNIEIFLEEGRSITGKPCMPKNGILSVVVESFLDGTIEDALLVPMSVSYEKLVDGNYIDQQSAKPKRMETFSTTLRKVWQILNSNFGMVKVDINQPFSLRELIKAFEINKECLRANNPNKMLKSNPSSNSLDGTDIASDEHRTLVENISKHVIYDCTQSTTIMSTNALAFLLLTKCRDGANLGRLANALEDLKHELEITGKDVGFSGDLVDVINYAVDLLGPALVKKEKLNNEDIIKPVDILPNVIELSYYSNSLVAHFALESVMALALNVSEISFDTVAHDDLMKNALELCDIFQYEFLFCKPCQSLEQVITSSIDDLIVRKEIFIMEENSEIVHRSRKLAAQFEDEENEIFQKLYQLNTNKQATDNRRNLRHILMPFIETYALTAFTLDRLIKRELLESELIGEVLSEMKDQLNRGSLKYAESIVVGCIKNGLKLYQKWDVLKCHNENQLRLYYLQKTYDDTESVQNVYKKINKYRI